MSKLTITQASQVVGLPSRTKIYQAIKSGLLSYDTDANGKKLIDPSELARVYPDDFNQDVFETFQKRSNRQKQTFQNRPETSLNTQKTSENVQLLQQQVAHLEERLKDSNILVGKLERDYKVEKDELRKDIAYHRQENERLTIIIEKQTLLLSAPELQPDKQQETTSATPQHVAEEKPQEKQGWWSRFWNGKPEVADR